MSARPRRSGWRLWGDPDLFESLRDVLEAAADRRGSERGPRALGDLDCYFKGSALRPGPGLRHATRRLLGVGEVPRLQEAANLAWLRARGLAAVRPVLAGVHAQGGLPRYQFLFTERLAGARDLAQALPGESPRRRADALRSLARTAARMHAGGFVHHDLFARNVLLPPAPDAECVLLDAWRSPPGRPARTPEHDLGCFLLDGASLLERAEQRLFLDAYREECGAAGRGLPPDWPARVEAARRRVLSREGRRRPEVAAEWGFPGKNPT